MTICDTKIILRKKIMTDLRSLAIDSQKLQSKMVCDKIINTSEYKNAMMIFAYLAIKNELSLDDLIFDAMKNKKSICIPKVIDKTTMEFYFLNNEIPLKNQVTIGKFGIREPLDTLKKFDTTKMTPPALMLLPGVAFDKNGGRLGRGAAYYDRYVARLHKNITLFGVCFNEQMVECVPCDKNDVKMDKVIFF